MFDSKHKILLVIVNRRYVERKWYHQFENFLLDIKCQNLQKVCRVLTQFQLRHEFEWSATVRFKLVLNSFKICQTVGTIEQKLQQMRKCSPNVLYKRIFKCCILIYLVEDKSLQILTVDELTVRLILSFPGLQRPVKFSFEYSTTRSNRSKEGKLFFCSFCSFLKCWQLI